MFDIMQSKGLALEGFPPYYTFHFPDHLLPWQYMLAFSSKFFQHHAPVQFFFPCLFIFFFFLIPHWLQANFLTHWLQTSITVKEFFITQHSLI